MSSEAFKSVVVVVDDTLGSLGGPGVPGVPGVPGGPWGSLGSLGVPGGPWGSLGVPGGPWGFPPYFTLRSSTFSFRVPESSFLESFSRII